MPAFMSASGLALAIGEFARAHPLVVLTVHFSDRPVGLIEAGYDLNIRVGWLDDSSMMSRKLGYIERVLVAGAGYAASRPAPVHPADLEDWDWLRYRNRADTTAFTGRDGQQEKVTGQGQIEVDSIDALYHLACQDAGVTVLPSFLADRGVAAGGAHFGHFVV